MHTKLRVLVLTAFRLGGKRQVFMVGITLSPAPASPAPRGAAAAGTAQVGGGLGGLISPDG